MNAKTIYIVRHGETDMNRQRIVQGSGVDAPLNETGQVQAQALFKHYGEIDFEVVLTSKLIRTHQTMAPFIDKGIPWEQFSEINEMGWGIHEGKKATIEMREEYLFLIQEWEKGNFHACLEGGESAAQLFHRITQFIEHLRERTENTILICSHGRAMSCLICSLKGMNLREMNGFKHNNTGLYKLYYRDNRFSFELENDTQHLLKLDNKIVL